MAGEPLTGLDEPRATWLVLARDGPSLELRNATPRQVHARIVTDHHAFADLLAAHRLRMVDVHIRWLRSKIEPQPDRPTHLVTIRGVGYRLDPPLTEP
jgi:predicted RNase H-like nuclease